MSQRQRIPWVALFVMFAVGVAVAADNGGNNGATPNLSKEDRHFVMDAAQGGILEVELGQYASDHASNADVKSFGQRMVTDHTRINDELKGIARDKGVNIPTSLNEKHQKKVDKLKEKQGKDFDEDYIKAMVHDHKKDIDAFEKEVKDGKDTELKEFAEKNLPTLREHLKLAEALEKQL